MRSSSLSGAVLCVAVLGMLAGCAGDPSEEAILPAPAEGIVNAPAGGIALTAPNVPPTAVYAFKPFADRFAAAYAAGGGSYARAVEATGGAGFTVLDAAALDAAFRGSMRRQFYLDTGGGATLRYTAEPVDTATAAGDGPAWRLESTGGSRYAAYAFRTVDGVARICLAGDTARCGAAFADADGTLGVIWERPGAGVTAWVYGPPAAL